MYVHHDLFHQQKQKYQNKKPCLTQRKMTWTDAKDKVNVASFQNKEKILKENWSIKVL